VFESVAAAQGDAEAQLRLARLHSKAPTHTLRDDGHNPVFDMAAAAKFCRLAAAQQHVDAMWQLGATYEKGDDAEAVKWYSMAADKGLLSAQVDLGRMLEEGRGVERDEAEAIRWCNAALGHGQGGLKKTTRVEEAEYRLSYIAAFGILQDGSQVRDAGAVADMLSRLGVKCGADLLRVGYDNVESIAKLLKPAAARAAFSFTGMRF
jgi:TPR repeat protein